MEDESPQIAGHEVRIVRRKGMRNIRLRVQGDGSLVVSAPPSATLAEMSDAVMRHEARIERQRERLAASPMAQATYASEEDKRAWRVIVEAAVPTLLEIWEPVIGVRVRKLAFRNMKSRWGSCQPLTGRVCINTRLALYPPRCLEYVVVHELVHMLEPSHNARFHELMDGFLPNWRERRALLRL
ncbi:MAG: SprT family zinc-dependent metalloprotease [Coriobacteriales bacterium]